LTISCKKKTSTDDGNFPPCAKSSENVSGRWTYGNDTLISIYSSVNCASKGNNQNYYTVIGSNKIIKLGMHDSITFTHIDTCTMLSMESNNQLDYNIVGVDNSFRISKQGGGWRFDVYYKSTGQYKSVTLLKI
jgi:hypothetical protein